MSATAKRNSTLELDRRFVARPGRRVPLVVDRAEDVYLWDVDGTRLLDFTSGWNVANVGWNRSELVDAVIEQAQKTAFAPPWCTTEVRAELAKRLCDQLPGEWQALSVATGSEAVEGAMKIARRFTGRHTIVSFQEAYHGGTLGSLLASGIPESHSLDLPAQTCHRYALPPDLLRYRESEVVDSVLDRLQLAPLPAAILVEPVFTNPGALQLSASAWGQIQQATTAVGALMIVDEVGTGIGRTGALFGFEQQGLEPDLIAISKGLSGGIMPIGATLFSRRFESAVFGSGFSSTFGWTPPACAAALAVLDILERESLCDAATASEAIVMTWGDELRRSLHCVADVRCSGLEGAVELRGADGQPLQKEAMLRISDKAIERGLFIESSRYTSSLLIMPPLTIEHSELRRGLDVLGECIEAVVPTDS